MVPATSVDATPEQLVPLLSPGDAVVGGENSYYRDDIRRSTDLAAKHIDYLDYGTSGGLWGLERGYCLMIGGSAEATERLEPLFLALAAGVGTAPRTEGRTGDTTPAEQGYLRCGPSGAGHFVKMVHNGIEYGLTASYAEGLNILRHAGSASKRARPTPKHRRYASPSSTTTRSTGTSSTWERSPKCGGRESVIASWLLDFTVQAFDQSPGLAEFEGRVSDSGAGRWTSVAAIDVSVPTPVLTAALDARFSSQGEADVGDKVLSTMRFGFGGHHETGR